MNYYLIQFYIRTKFNPDSKEIRLVSAESYEQATKAIREEFEGFIVSGFENLTIETESDECDANEVDIY